MEEIVAIELRVIIASVPMAKGIAFAVDLILPQHRRGTSFTGGTYVSTVQRPIPP